MQADLFEAHPSIVLLPLTSELRKTPLFRISVAPTSINGLRRASQIMVDKPQSVAREKIGAAFGRIDEDTLVAVSRSLMIFLGLA